MQTAYRITDVDRLRLPPKIASQADRSSFALVIVREESAEVIWRKFFR